MREARKVAHARLLTAQETMKETFDRRRRANTFRVGDSVWVWCVMHRIGNAKKLEPKYKGAFRIVARVGSNSFVIEDSNVKRDTVNVEAVPHSSCSSVTPGCGSSRFTPRAIRSYCC